MRTKTLNVDDPIAGLLRYYDLDAAKLAKVWHCGERTARRRMKAPENITVLELRLLIKAGVPKEKIGEAIK